MSPYVITWRFHPRAWKEFRPNIPLKKNPAKFKSDLIVRLANGIAEAVGAHFWTVYVPDPTDKTRIIKHKAGTFLKTISFF